jgi:hypothetical protein
VLLAGAAAFLAVGIWTMHFIGMLAAPLPPETAYLVLPTVVSFLICALVVGVSLFFVSIGPPAWPRVAGSAVLVEGGICTMHYVGMHGLSGPFEMQHDPLFVILSALIAIGAAFGGLRAFLAGQGGIQLVFSASEPWILQRRRPRRPAVSRLPVEGADGVHFIEAAEVRSIRADAHCTRVHDGTRERMCLSSISKVETQLDPDLFLRVHRSHIVALSHVILVRREGDGAVIKLNGAATQRVPVSRAWGETGRQPRGRAVRPQHVPEQGHHGYFVEPVLPHLSLVILGASPVALSLATQAREGDPPRCPGESCGPASSAHRSPLQPIPVARRGSMSRADDAWLPLP